ncbi:MAG TPA: glycosyltransferase [Mycobacteriales bacterium]|nr:glycosyltransferase [Mycobacteriales bacterium]
MTDAPEGAEPAKDDLRPITFSILTPVWNTDPDVLRATIESVLHQDYPYWQLCLVNDASTRPETVHVLDHYARFDPRVRVRHRQENGGISAASNDAIAMSVGEYTALLDHDDLLSLDALGAVAHEIYLDPTLDVIYSDEDKVDMEGNTFGEYFKPGWSPELLFGQMVNGHLTVYRSSLISAVGGFRPECMGSQDWDLALRITERTDRIKHIPRLLYHWRQVPGSTSVDVQAKPYTITAARKAIGDALQRRGIRGHVEDSFIGGHFHVRYDLTEEPKVSVIIPTAGGHREVRGEDVRLIDRCLRGLVDRTDYANLEIVVVLSPGTDPALRDELLAIDGERLRFVEMDGTWTFSRAINLGAAAATGELLLMLNDDVEPAEADWLRRLVELSVQPGIGAVGPKLLFEDGTIQHAGIVGVGGNPVHNVRRWQDGPGYFGELMLTKNYLAVTGACLLTRASDFWSVGGLSDEFPVNFNDIDYCLKLYRRGLRNVFEPQAVLYHYESSSRPPTVSVDEMARFTQRWGHVMGQDPYFTAPHAAYLLPHFALT